MKIIYDGKEYIQDILDIKYQDSDSEILTFVKYSQLEFLIQKPTTDKFKVLLKGEYKTILSNKLDLYFEPVITLTDKEFDNE